MYVYVTGEYLPNTLGKWIYIERIINLPFPPTPKLKLQFGSEGQFYTLEISQVTWDVGSETFTVETRNLETWEDNFPVESNFYLRPEPRQPATELCPHMGEMNINCDCPLLFDTDSLITFLKADGWDVRCD